MASVRVALRHNYEELTGNGNGDTTIPLKDNHVQTYPVSSGHAHQFRRYYVRGLVGIFAPLIIAIFFIVVWQVYLFPLDDDPAFVAGPPGASLVFYAWFIIGVLGLNLSLYGMKGVEAGMLMGMTPDARVPKTLMAYDKYASGTWSGPDGWIKTVNRLMRHGVEHGNGSRLPWSLWLALAVPSLLVFIALPISGLSLETDTGYIIRGGNGGAGPNITGFTYSNFNERNTDEALSGAATMWKNSMDARIPGMGVVYTRPNADPVTPSILPKDDGLSSVFLAAQAEGPIDGTAWGLALQYNCSIVKSLSDLTVLKRRNASEPYTGPRVVPPVFEGFEKGENLATVVNETGGFDARAMNLNGLVEFGAKIWPNKSVSDQLSRDNPNALFTQNQACYFSQAKNVTGDYPGLDEETVFEMILWQHIFQPEYIKPPKYNLTIDHNITELYGAYNMNRWTSNNTTSSNFSVPLTAVGARCVSSSSVGTARVDGVHSTYTDFEPTDTPINLQKFRCAQRFGAAGIHAMLTGSMMEKPTNGKGTWMSQLFDSVAASPPFYALYDSPDEIDVGTGSLIQLQYLQADQLKNSLLRAHAAYAVQLMYSGGQGFSAQGGSATGSVNPNVTAFQPGTVLKPGPVPVYVPGVFFLVWTVASLVLTAMYGFRRRWADTVDEGIRSFRRQ
jgi:hypothetical protein